MTFEYSFQDSPEDSIWKTTALTLICLKTILRICEDNSQKLTCDNLPTSIRLNTVVLIKARPLVTTDNSLQVPMSWIPAVEILAVHYIDKFDI